MNRFQCYVSAMTVASVSSMSIGNRGSMGGPMPTMSSSFQTASLSSSSHPQHYNPGYHPLAIRSSSSATVLRSSRGGRRDRDCLIAHLSTEPLSSIIDPANDDTITNDDDDDVDNDDHHEKNAFATSYHAPVMHEECIDALLQRSHNQTKKKQKYKSKAVAAAALLREYEQREDDSFSPMVDIDIDGGDSSTVVCDTIGGGGGGGGGSTRPRVFIDGTLGGGGHSHHLLRQLAANDVVIGVDVDPSALATASDRLRQYIVSTDDTVDNAKEEHDKPIFLPIQSNFKDMVEVLKDVTHPITGELLLRQRQQRRADDDDDDDDDDGDETVPFSGVDGILLDLGVSSHQIDTMERGFAFMKDGPLDMRMGNGSWKNQVTDTTTQTSTTNDTNQQPSPPPTNSCLSTLTAADICNEFTENDLIQTFQTHANETRSRARRIAQSIISHRPLRTTADLKAAIAAVTPAFHKKSRRMGQMATCGRIFSALRIVVNREDDVLTEALEGMAPGVVGKGGRLVVLSYHSLEDRAVKRVMRDGMVEGRSGVGVNLERDVYGNEIVDGEIRPWRTLGKRMKATDVEIERNRRARSATLRVAERL